MDNYIYMDISDNIRSTERFQKLNDTVIEYGEDLTIFLLQKPLAIFTDRDYYENGILIVIPNKAIYLFDCGDDSDLFEDYCEDIIDDLNSLIVEKYPQYFSLLGRKREWSKLIEKISEIPTRTQIDTITNKEHQRKIDLISSLCIGSINELKNFDKSLLSKSSLSTLESIRNKIILFDTDQTKFIYEDKKNKKLIRVQGLAGSGKTELLLHKIRQIFVSDNNARIAVTCFNRVLADSLKVRVVDFFNRMKVSEQITDTRLFIAHSWGSRNNSTSGLYARICAHYKIPFQPFSRYKQPKEIWNEAIECLENKSYEPIFDYLFIDEGQDFDDSFIKLCDMVTAKQVFIAGDVLQNIFSNNNIINYTDTDYILSKVYRTDPRTLLFSHVLGFGLLEPQAVRWLEKKEWELSGYNITKVEDSLNDFVISRKMIKRFEVTDETDDIIPISIYPEVSLDTEIITSNIINIINSIKRDNPDVAAKDIAIIFTKYNENIWSNFAILLGQELNIKFGWDYLLAPREKRTQLENEVTITNINNVKGLEFPFVIIVANDSLNYISDKNIDVEVKKRNALYMALTRSFISSYLVIEKNNEIGGLIDKLVAISTDLHANEAKLTIQKPKKIISKELLYGIRATPLKTQDEIIQECMEELNLDSKTKSALRSMLKLIPVINEGTTNKEIIKAKIQELYSTYTN